MDARCCFLVSRRMLVVAAAACFATGAANADAARHRHTHAKTHAADVIPARALRVVQIYHGGGFFHFDNLGNVSPPVIPPTRDVSMFFGDAAIYSDGARCELHSVGWIFSLAYVRACR
jgi:hypothetical protein